MCDRIKMPDGLIVESVRGDGDCLCKSRDKEILEWIVNHVSDHVTLEIGMQLIIDRDPFGWVVTIEKVCFTGSSSPDSTIENEEKL
jgi:hypothetical protein